MLRSPALIMWIAMLPLSADATDLFAQRPPYDVFPPAELP